MRIALLFLILCRASPAATISVQSSVTGPLSGLPFSVIRDFHFSNYTFTLLVTGGTGTGYVIPELAARGATDECNNGACLERGEADALVRLSTPSGSYEADGGFGGLPLGVSSDILPRIPFTFDVPQRWLLELNSTATVSSQTGRFSGNPWTSSASFTAPTGCVADAGLSSPALACNVALLQNPEPASLGLAGLGCGLLILLKRRARSRCA